MTVPWRPRLMFLAMVVISLGCQVNPTRRRTRPAPPVPHDVLTRLRPDAIPLIGTPAESPTQDEVAEPAQPNDKLQLEEVILGIDANFPLVMAALADVDAAEARLRGTAGKFDTYLSAKGSLDSEGFYESERFDIGLTQPTRWWGAKFSGGYRIGTGDFAVYDGKAKTDEGGEFRAGISLPLLRGRKIDSNRVAEWRALLDLERAQPLLNKKRIEAMSKGAEAYWKWVSAGLRLEVAQLQLSLAETRQEQIQASVDEGFLAPISITDNERSIVSRRSKEIAAQQKFRASAIQLSLYLRDAKGHPIVPLASRLPFEFPSPRSLEDIIVPNDRMEALRRRPELTAMEIELSKFELDIDLAKNGELPSLDVGVFASQDVGPTINSPDNKGPFELSLGMKLDVPLQRRTPIGKTKELKAKIRKLKREIQFARDMISVEVQDAVIALEQNLLRLQQARDNVRLTLELAEAERFRVRAGESDLFRLNQREQQSAAAAELQVLLLEEHFRSIVRYSAVLGIPYAEVLRTQPR